MTNYPWSRAFKVSITTIAILISFALAADRYANYRYAQGYRQGAFDMYQRFSRQPAQQKGEELANPSPGYRIRTI